MRFQNGELLLSWPVMDSCTAELPLMILGATRFECSVLEVGVVDTVLDFLLDDGIGFDERLLETGVEGLESLGANSLLLAASFGVFGLELGEAVLLGDLNSLLGGLAGNLGVGVDSLHEGLVLQGVLSGGSLLDGVLLNVVKLGLNLVRVDDSGEIGAGHHASVKMVASLLDGLLSVGTEDVVEVLEGIGGEDDEAAEVTTGGELEQVKSVDVAHIDAGEVTGDSLDVGVLVTVDNKGTLGHGETGVSLLVGTSTKGLGGANSLHVLGGTNLFKSSEKGLGGVNVEGVDDERELRHGVNVVTSGQNEGSDSGGGEGGGDGVSLLVLVDLAVPLSPDLKGGEHATLTAHVTEGSLTGS
jgi:hypothetical protein